MASEDFLRKMNDLKHRVFINGIGVCLVAILVFFAQWTIFSWFFAGAVALVSAISLWEFYELVRKKGFSPATLLCILLSIGYIFAIFLKYQGATFPGALLWRNIPSIFLALIFFGSFISFALTKKDSIVNLSTTLFGWVYVTIPLSLIIRIVYFFLDRFGSDPYFEGSWWLAYLIAVTKSGDMGGYFVGKFFGSRKIAPKLSPNKTLEGSIGGLIASILMSLVFFYLGKRFEVLSFLSLSYAMSFFLGLLIGILGQMGDFAESLLKRDAKVKDSNRLPGVGGVLDEIDSLIFTIPVVYIFLNFHYTWS